MPRIAPKDRTELGDFEALFKGVEGAMGFVPNSFFTFAHWPELMQSFAGFAGTVLGPGTIDPGLKQLIAFMSSNASGCRYCQAHTSHSAEKRGVDTDKIAAVFEYETSPIFTPAERSALRVAARAGSVPNGVEDEDFDALRKHYSEREIVEIVAVISLFGFLNRWNDTVATELEASPLRFADTHLAGHGWQAGKHAT